MNTNIDHDDKHLKFNFRMATYLNILSCLDDK